MNKIRRTAQLATLAFFSVWPVNVLVPRTFAGTPPASTSKIKRYRKHKKNKEIVLKGHRGHTKKPA